MRDELLLVAVLSLVTAPALAHSWYSDQHNERGDSCCGGRDCVPITDPLDVREEKGGYYIQSLRTFVPNSRAKPSPEEDGRYHVCYWGQEVKCFFFPSRGY